LDVPTTFVSATEVRALALPQKAGPVDVLVTNVDGQSSLPLAAFTYK